MSPIRTKPFRTRSAGQQTTKVLDGKCRVFPSTIDAGRFATVKRDLSEIDLSVRFMKSSSWYSPESTSAANYMVGYNNRISGYSTNTSNNSEGYFIIAVNKMCRIYYDLTISSENGYDWGYIRLSRKGTYTVGSVYASTGSQRDLIPRISGETNARAYIDMDAWNTAYNYGDNYDIGLVGGQGEMLLCLEYDTDGSASSGSNRFTVNSLYVTDIP